jgi:hypothetical protein
MTSNKDVLLVRLRGLLIGHIIIDSSTDPSQEPMQLTRKYELPPTDGIFECHLLEIQIRSEFSRILGVLTYNCRVMGTFDMVVCY